MLEVRALPPEPTFLTWEDARLRGLAARQRPASDPERAVRTQQHHRPVAAVDAGHDLRHFLWHHYWTLRRHLTTGVLHPAQAGDDNVVLHGSAQDGAGQPVGRDFGAEPRRTERQCESEPQREPWQRRRKLSRVSTIWVADLTISQATAGKIARKHGISEQEIRAHVVAVAGLRFRWHDHPERGRRAIIETVIQGERVLVVLYPKVRDTYGDSWNLGSVYPTNR
jgi:hypothetical protein